MMRPPTNSSGSDAVSAAKLHVLGLGPLKERLGPRWDRLSDLVHRLMEKAIRAAQGPADHCIVLDELSYAVTFGNLSLAQANRVCAAIARNVCVHLFGDQIDEVSVRSIVAEIVTLEVLADSDLGAKIEALVERHGTESIFTHGIESGSPDPVVIVAGAPPASAHPVVDHIEAINVRFAQFGLRLGILPIWDLNRGTSNCLYVTAFSGSASGAIPAGRLSRTGVSDQQILDMELDQLLAASLFAQELHDAHKACAIGVGVSYSSVNGFRSRIRYITALQKARFFPKNPLLLKIEQIPEGAPESRIADLIAMLSLTNVKITLEFQALSAITNVELRVGPIGIGGVIPPGLDRETAMTICGKLANHATSHKLFAFLDHLDTPDRVAMAAKGYIRFGMGAALTQMPFEKLDLSLQFPMKRSSAGAGF